MLNFKQSKTLEELESHFSFVREQTERLVAPLNAEDMVAQSMVDASPAKWHLAHTTWFFEKLVLEPSQQNYRPFDEEFYHLYNSYYQSLGTPHTRSERGLITRPAVERVLEYRHHITKRITALLEGFDQVSQQGSDPSSNPSSNPSSDQASTQAEIVELGLHHEMQHQELLLMDILHLFAQNPTNPIYKGGKMASVRQTPPLEFIAFEGGLVSIGSDPNKGFAYDCELPHHKHYLAPYKLANRLVTNGEWLEFIRDGGYQKPSLWLSDGWDWLNQHQITAPLYWRCHNEAQFTLGGLIKLNKQAPVCHVSYYEAAAFAKWAGSNWAGARLPTEQEWEYAANATKWQPSKANFVESDFLTPKVASLNPAKSPLQQMAGDVWEWTASPFTAYTGYEPPANDSLAEYNGKFMCSQMVMRGGSCFTPQSHIRSGYRNFFYPQMRWQMGGVRLAQ